MAQVLSSRLPVNYWAKVEQAGTHMLWTGAQNSRGYGCFRVDGKSRLAHRLAWENENGPIPDGYTIDHLCRIKVCVNTAHMEVVTRAEIAAHLGVRKTSLNKFMKRHGLETFWAGVS